MPLPKERIHTIDDIYNLPEGERAELINGQIYYMAPPSTAPVSYTHLDVYKRQPLPSLYQRTK